jgi:hypothetical protein
MATTRVFDYRTFDPWKRLREIGMFFKSQDPVHGALRRLVRRLRKADIPYAVMGAMAVNLHGARRTTDHVDILLSADGLERSRHEIVPRFYKQVEGRPRRFLERKSGVQLEDKAVRAIFGRPIDLSACYNRPITAVAYAGNSPLENATLSGPRFKRRIRFMSANGIVPQTHQETSFHEPDSNAAG